MSCRFSNSDILDADILITGTLQFFVCAFWRIGNFVLYKIILLFRYAIISIPFAGEIRGVPIRPLPLSLFAFGCSGVAAVVGFDFSFCRI